MYRPEAYVNALERRWGETEALWSETRSVHWRDEQADHFATQLWPTFTDDVPGLINEARALLEALRITARDIK